MIRALENICRAATSAAINKLYTRAIIKIESSSSNSTRNQSYSITRYTHHAAIDADVHGEEDRKVLVKSEEEIEGDDGGRQKKERHAMGREMEREEKAEQQPRDAVQRKEEAHGKRKKDRSRSQHTADINFPLTICHQTGEEGPRRGSGEGPLRAGARSNRRGVYQALHAKPAKASDGYL